MNTVTYRTHSLQFLKASCFDHFNNVCGTFKVLGVKIGFICVNVDCKEMPLYIERLLSRTRSYLFNFEKNTHVFGNLNCVM